MTGTGTLLSSLICEGEKDQGSAPSWFHPALRLQAQEEAKYPQEAVWEAMESVKDLQSWAGGSRGTLGVSRAQQHLGPHPGLTAPRASLSPLSSSPAKMQLSQNLQPIQEQISCPEGSKHCTLPPTPPIPATAPQAKPRMEPARRGFGQLWCSTAPPWLLVLCFAASCCFSPTFSLRMSHSTGCFCSLVMCGSHRKREKQQNESFSCSRADAAGTTQQGAW